MALTARRLAFGSRARGTPRVRSPSMCCGGASRSPSRRPLAIRRRAGARRRRRRRAAARRAGRRRATSRRRWRADAPALVTLAIAGARRDVRGALRAASSRCTRRVVPLGLTITKFGGAAPQATRRSTITRRLRRTAWGRPRRRAGARRLCARAVPDPERRRQAREPVLRAARRGRGDRRGTTTFGAALPTRAAITRGSSTRRSSSTPRSRPRQEKETQASPTPLPLDRARRRCSPRARPAASGYRASGSQRYAGPAPAVMPRGRSTSWWRPANQLAALGRRRARRGKPTARRARRWTPSSRAHPERHASCSIAPRYEVTHERSGKLRLCPLGAARPLRARHARRPRRTFSACRSAGRQHERGARRSTFRLHGPGQVTGHRSARDRAHGARVQYRPPSSPTISPRRVRHAGLSMARSRRLCRTGTPCGRGSA